MFNPNIQYDIPKEHTVIGDGSASPFYLDGWLKWNEEMWGVKAERVLYTNGKSEYPYLHGVIYTNKKGQVIQPPRNPHLPFRFVSTATDKASKLYTQYLDIMKLFVDDLAFRGLATPISLPPGFIDARPFYRKGFRADLRYTFMSALPYSISNCDSAVRNKIKKAEKIGCTVRESYDWEAVFQCMKDTEDRKSFDHFTDQESLVLLKEKLSNNFKVYLGYSDKDIPISVGLRLGVEKGICYFWTQGTKREYLNTGVVQLLHRRVLDFLHMDLRCALVDWGGANTPPVALAKSAWGMQLVPYLTVRQKNWKYIGSLCKECLKNKIKGFK